MRIWELLSLLKPSLMNSSISIVSNMPTLFNMLRVSVLLRLAANGKKRYLANLTLHWCRHLTITRRRFVTMWRRWWDESHSCTSYNAKDGCVKTSTICRICLRTHRTRTIIWTQYLNRYFSVSWTLNLPSVKLCSPITIGISRCLMSGKIFHTSMVVCLSVMRKMNLKPFPCRLLQTLVPILQWIQLYHWRERP